MKTRLINRTERLTAIERMLFRSDMGLRVVEIAQACGVDRRTIYRDLSLLTDIGVPIFQSDGRFYINRDYYLANVRLSLNEAAALFVAARVLSHHAEQQNPHIVSALRKLSMALPEPAASHVAYMAESVSDPVDPGFVAVLETMIHAWSERRKVKLWYSSLNSREATAREFAIYFIEPTPSGSVYVIGYDSLSQRVRPFMLQRVKRAKLLRGMYEIPNHFNPRRYLSSAWGMVHSEVDDVTEVILTFSAEVAPFIKGRVWHASQRIDTLANDQCILSVEVTDWHDMLPWIRSWGAQVQVVKPQVLRDLLAAEAAQVASQYRMAGQTIIPGVVGPAEIAQDGGHSY
jgi:predicted DNA-binding transcriptional regulator YafY